MLSKVDEDNENEREGEREREKSIENICVISVGRYLQGVLDCFWRGRTDCINRISN